MRTMSSMEGRIRVFVVILAIVVGSAILHAADNERVVLHDLHGETLSHSLIGTNPVRKLAIYLPAGYKTSTERYPVIYYLPNPLAKFDENFYRGPVRELLDR